MSRFIAPSMVILGLLASYSTAGVVAYYRFEGTPGQSASGIGTILDSSGNGLAGTPVGSPVYAGSVAANPVPQTGSTNQTSMAFNGSTQRIAIADDPRFQTASLTLEAFVFAEPIGAG